VIDRSTGEPIEGADVSLNFVIEGLDQDLPPPRFGLLPGSRTDQNGQVRHEGIMPVEMDVWAQADDYGPEKRRVQVVEGQTTEVEIAIAPALIVIAYGWTGQHVTRGFEFAARTREQEASNGRAEVFNAGLRETKDSFKAIFDEVKSRNQWVKEFHYYSHAGLEDGPIFTGGAQYNSVGELASVPQVRWTEDGRAYFYGCTSAFGWFSPAFATHQNVTVRASVGYTSFSSMRDGFQPIPELLMTGPPVYQASFLTRTETHRRINEQDANLLVQILTGILIVLPTALMSYTIGTGNPPLPMATIPPGSSPQNAEAWFGRGDDIPTFGP